MSLYSRLDRIAADVEKLNRQVNSVANAPQSQRTSVEGGSIDFNDADGNLKAIIGMQDDGGYTTNVISGPTPPTPANFTVEVDYGKLVVHWDGSFDDALVAPTDWARAEVYAQEGQFVTPSRELARGSMVAASGGEVTVGVLRGTWTVCMAGWSQAGIMSPMSTPVTVEVPGYGDLVQETLDEAQALIDEAKVALEAGQADLAGKITDAEAALSSLQSTLDNLDSTTLPALRSDLDAAEGRLDTAEGQITDAFGQLDAVPGQISDARQAAIDAAQAELDQVEGTLTSMIGGKSATKWSTSNPPAQYSGAVGDTWVKLTSLGSGGREIKRSRWQGDVWVDHPVDGAVLSNVDASTITTGFLDVANRVRAGAISADKVVIGSGGNLISWDQVLQGKTYFPHRVEGGPGSIRLAGGDGGKGVPAHIIHTREPGDAGVNRYIMSFRPSEQVVSEPTRDRFAVTGGSWRFSVRAYSNVANNLVRLTLIWYRGDGSYGAAVTSVPTTMTIAVQTVAVEIELPEDAAYIIPYVRSTQPGEIHFAQPELRQKVGSTLIEPGGIQTPHLASDVLEVGNLKAGAGEIAEVVSQKIAAAVGQFLELDVGQLTVTGASKLAAVVAEQIAADVGEYVELSVGQLVAGEGVMDEATVQKLFTDVVVAGISQAQEFIGENAILTGAVTAPKIVASEELWAKLGQFVKIRAEHIQSDALDFMVARGGTYLTSAGNGSWSDNGLFISGPDGTSLVRFPTDGSPLSLTASDVQIDRATISDLDTTQQTVRSGGTVTLASGVTAPASPPELTAAWRRNVQLTRPAESSMDWTGLGYWNGKYVRGVNVLGSEGDSADRIDVYNPDGTLNKAISIDLNPRAGVAVIGDIVYTIGPDHVAANAGKQWCHGFNLNTGARVSRWEFTRFFASGQKKIATGADGTNLLVAGIGGSPATLYVLKYNPSTGAQVGSDLTATFDTGRDADVHGVAHLGGKIYVSPRGQVREYTVSGSTLTKTSGFAWDNPNWNSGGFVFVEGRPIVVDTATVYTGSTFTTEASLQVCYTWWNGSQETTPSPIANVALKSRESLTVSMAKRVGLQKRIYVRTGTTGNWYRQVVGNDVTSLPISDFGAGSGWGSLFPLPTANTFPASAPAVLKSGGGNFEARGDGSGKWGPLTFAANGAMTGITPVAGGSIVITPTANTPTTVTVTLPTGRFTGDVAVTATAGSTVGGDVVKFVGTSGVSTTTFDLTLHRTTSTDTRVYWTAIGAD